MWLERDRECRDREGFEDHGDCFEEWGTARAEGRRAEEERVGATCRTVCMYDTVRHKDGHSTKPGPMNGGGVRENEDVDETESM